MNIQTFFYLFVTVIAEVVGVAALKESKQFTELAPSIIAIISYMITLYFLTLVMKTMTMSIAYALWAAFGMVFVVCVGVFYYKENLDITAMIGTAFIAVGIVLINLFSKTVH